MLDDTESNTQEVAKMFEGEVDKVPFQVTDPSSGGQDLTDVKPNRVLVPPTSKILMKIQKVVSEALTVNRQEDASDENPVELKRLNVSFKLLEPILQPEMDGDGQATGVMKEKFKGTVLFQRITFWANPAIKNSDWYKRNQHLLDYKSFLLALAEDIASTPEVNDEWLSSLAGRELRANITVKFRQVLDTDSESSTYNKWINTSEQDNEVKGFAQV